MDKNWIEFIIFESICLTVLLLIIFYLIYTYKRVKSGKVTIKEEVELAKVAVWRNLRNLGYRVSYNLESLKEVDRFIADNVSNGEPKVGGYLESDFGEKLFALGAYVGEVIRKKYGGKWQFKEVKGNKEALVDLSIRLRNGTVIFPFHKVAKRIKNGDADNLYFYGKAIKSIKETN